MEGEINKFFEICYPGEEAELIETQETSDAIVDIEATAAEDQGFALTGRSKMTTRLTIPNWDTERDQSDSAPENKANPIKELETEINKFFEICQWDENGKFIDIYPESNSIIVDATHTNNRATKVAKEEESQSQ